MPLFKSLKRAFGFSDAEMEEAELEGIDATVVPLKARTGTDTTDLTTPEHASEDAPAENSGAQLASAESDAGEQQGAVPSAIFETVVKLFNESLPGFLRESVDTKAQCEYIYRQLDQSMKLYLEQVASDARRNLNDRWEAERRQLQAQMSTLQAKLRKDEEENNETKKQHLSAERQKRALSERVRDLETQLQKLEADNEQLTLENKSMANKLRVSSVLGTEVPDADLEANKALALKINELTSSLETANSNLESVRQELAEATTLAETRKADLAAAADTRLKAEQEAERLNAELAKEKALRLEHESHLNTLKQSFEESRAKDDVSDAMLSDLNNKLGTAKAALEASEDRCRDLQTDNDKLKAELEKQSAELSQAMENLAIVEQMHVQLTQLEDARRNNEIYVRKKKEELSQANERLHQLELESDELKQSLAQKESTIVHLEDLTASLRKTIESNLYEHAQCQSGLRAEIERLKKLRGVAADNADANLGGELGSGLASIDDFSAPSTRANSSGKKRDNDKNAKRNRKIAISAIDESIEDTDWLVATPPEPRKTDPDSPDESEFGYKAPQRKNTPENPDQMLLF